MNWQSFDIGSNHSVDFAQPDASAAVLSRVNGPDASGIAGVLRADGSLYSVNSHGFTFFRGSTVDTGGAFVASALSIPNSAFISGDRIFPGAPPSGSAISNAGTITVGGGRSALIADTVRNSGVIIESTGTLSVTTGATGFRNSGELDIGAAGSLKTSGLFTLAGRLSVELGGTGAGEFGSVVSGAAAELSGGLAVTLAGLYQPRSGDVFDVVQASSFVGGFSALDLPDLNPGLTWREETVSLGTGLDAFRLEVAGPSTAVPEPQSWAMLLMAAAVAAWGAARLRRPRPIPPGR